MKTTEGPVVIKGEAIEPPGDGGAVTLVAGPGHGAGRPGAIKWLVFAADNERQIEMLRMDAGTYYWRGRSTTFWLVASLTLHALVGVAVQWAM